MNMSRRKMRTYLTDSDNQIENTNEQTNLNNSINKNVYMIYNGVRQFRSETMRQFLYSKKLYQMVLLFLIKLKNTYFSMKMKFQQIHIFYHANLYKRILILIYSRTILPKKVGKLLISCMLIN